MARIKIGDIIEIATRKGLVYAQFTDKNKLFGSLIRVFSVYFKKRPEKFDFVNEISPGIICFVPLNALIGQDIFKIVGNTAISDRNLEFPVFRAGMLDPTTGKVRIWWLWDGEKEWPIGELTREQRKLPIREIVNDTLLIERIESGWSPERDSVWI